MTPARMPGTDIFRFNRKVKGVGRIQKTSETNNRVEFRYRDGLITKLIKNKSLDILRDFKAGRLSIGDLIAADREDRLLQVSGDMKMSRLLQPELDAWLPLSAAAKASRKRYEVSWNRLMKVAKAQKQLPADPRVSDLARINYIKLGRVWDASGSDFNRARAAVSSFLTEFLGSVHHPFRLEVMGLFKRQRENRGRVPTLTVGQFWTIVGAARDYVSPKYVALAVLGVGPKELRGIRKQDLHREQLTVMVNGTKAPERRREVAVDERLWTWIERAVSAPLSYKWLRQYWLDACTKAKVDGVTMYDLRHLSGQLAGDAGIQDRDITVHLGHSDPTMSHRYTRRTTARRVAKAIGDALS